MALNAQPTPRDYRFLDRLRVRWVEVDAQQVVFNGHYLMYADTAIAGYWRALALPYHETFARWGGDLVVRKATLEYEAPAQYDDVLDVGLRLSRVGTTSLAFDCAMFRADALLVHGELHYVHVEAAARRPSAVPAPLREAMEAFEAGQPMLQVRTGDWTELGAQAQALRTAVFVQEQGIPAALEWDAADAEAVHAVAFNRLGMPLGTGRLLPHGPGCVKIGRMAVMRPMRGSRVGRAVLDALVQAARSRGQRQVLLHAQASAVGFYRRAGFVDEGPAFHEAGIPHQAMVMTLSTEGSAPPA